MKYRKRPIYDNDGAIVIPTKADGTVFENKKTVIYTDSGIKSCPTNTPTPIYNCASPGIYLVSFYYSANEVNNPYFGFAVVSVDSTTKNKIHLSNLGIVVYITMSNLTINIEQRSGITLNMKWSVLRLI